MSELDQVQSQPNISRGSLLIVDDTPNNLRLLSSMLAQHGYEVRSAISGANALMTISVAPPDLILLNINMPVTDGYEVCKRLKADPATCEIPIIFLSALDDLSDKVMAFEVGGVDYISKPFHIEEVVARVESQLELRRMRLELQQAKAEALSALQQEKELNRLKSEFVSMVSHDFRTPLTSIQGFAELLRENLDNLTPEKRDRYFQKINAAVENLLDLLDEVLLLGGLDSGKMQCHPTPLALERFCRDLVEAVSLGTHYSHHIELSYGGDSKPVALDATLLRQILTNLLTNAMKYSPDCDRIWFDVQCEAHQVTFRVRDNGIGIPAENQSRLFETFYRCNNVGTIKGTGLGLAVTKRCIDAHQGTIAVKSTVGVGTTMIVTLPLSPACA